VIFGELGLHRVTVEVPERMEALCKFIEKRLKFQREGVKREAMLWKGDWGNIVMYGKLANGEVK
jgi:RimJ/RimL family protein N-acetyltransferase